MYNNETTLKKQKNFIAGKYICNDDGKTFKTIHPGNNKIICEVEIAGNTEINIAVASAKEAFESWSKTPAAERGAILRRAATILRQKNSEIASLETLDTGKPISETSVVDIISGAEVIEYFAGIAQSIQGNYIDLPPEAFALIRREPLGVCAGIGAWNYPIQIAMWKSAPALACGNTMVFKPAEETPLTTLKLAEIYQEAGLPPGVFNVIQGSAKTGMSLINHPDIAKITLTGSVETGKTVMKVAANQLKKITLELGGKSPIIVFKDANFENAINAVLAGNFFSSGQVCSNGTRVFIQKSISDEFIKELVDRTKKIKLGDPFDYDTRLGPLISQDHYQKVQKYIKIAKSSKATHLCGGDLPKDASLKEGYFISPAIFANCNDDMKFVKDEVFGPLMSLLTFESEDEAIKRANNTNFGLAGAVFSQNFSRAHRVANQLKAGSVWINDYNITPAEIPFGGYKESGIGRENGIQTIEHFTQIKTIYANLGDVPKTY